MRFHVKIYIWSLHRIRRSLSGCSVFKMRFLYRFCLFWKESRKSTNDFGLIIQPFSRDGNRTQQNAFRSCDSNFVRKTIEIERIRNFYSQIKRTLLRSKTSLAMSWFHQFEALFSCEKMDCFSFDWCQQSYELNAVSHDLNATFERVTCPKCSVDVATFMKTAVQKNAHYVTNWFSYLIFKSLSFIKITADEVQILKNSSYKASSIPDSSIILILLAR